MENNTIYVVDLLVTFYSETSLRLESIESFIYDLKKKFGFFFHTGTADSYQSAQFIQKAKEKYLAQNCAVLSVDRAPTQYNFLANIVAQGFLKVGECSGVADLKEQMSAVTEGEGGKIMKPMITAKNHCDALDALCGAVWNAYINTKDIPSVLYLPPDVDISAQEEVLLDNVMSRLKLTW